MKIDYTCLEKIDNMYLHDAVFNSLMFDYGCKRIEIDLIPYLVHTDEQNRNIFSRYRRVLCFNNVMLCNMTTYDAWYPSERLNGVSTEPVETELFEKIKTAIKPRIDSAEKLIKIYFEFISGDSIEIVCESVDYVDTPLSD